MSSDPRQCYTIRFTAISPSLDEHRLYSLLSEQDAALIIRASLAPDPLASSPSKVATVTFERVPSFAKEKRKPTSTFEWDEDLYGLTPLNNVEGQVLKVDIVAITGLAGRAFGSWQNDKGSMWLRDYLPQDLPGARVFIYGYPSKLHKSVSRASLWDYTEGFMRTMAKLTKSGEVRRPLILIGHSLGCVIIKQAMVESMSFTNPMPHFYRSVCGIVFFGAPHRGLNNPALVNILADKPPAELVRDLCPGSSLLVSLNHSFPHICRDFDVVTCFETRATNTVQLVNPDDPESPWERTGPPAFSVPRDSACLDWPNEHRIAVHADHSEIAKLTNSPGSAYHQIRDEIKALVEHAPEIMMKRNDAYLATQDVLDLAFTLQYEFSWLKAWGSLTTQIDRVEEDLTGTSQNSLSAIPHVPYGHPAYHTISEVSLLAENLGILLEHHRETSSPLSNEGRGGSAYTSLNSDYLPPLPSLKFLDPARIRGNADPSRTSQEGRYRISDWSTSDRAQLGFIVQRLQQANSELMRIMPYSQSPDLIASSELINQFSAESTDLKRVDRMRPAESYSSMSRRASLKRQYNDPDISEVAAKLLKPISSIDVKRDSSIADRHFFTPFRDKVIEGQHKDFEKETWVLVEWRYYDKANTLTKQREAEGQAFKLARDLSIEKKPSSLRALHCVGLVQDSGSKRFGFLFGIPPRSDVTKKPLSLHSYLKDASHWGSPAVLPTFSQRIKLAQSLAVSMWELHNAGWLHKSFHSGNVLFFCQRFSNVVSVVAPFIGGFEVSRPDADGQLSLDVAGSEFDIYKHPELRDPSNDVQGRPTFERRHDVYSLGLILLEIGLWEPLCSFYKESSTPLQTAQRLMHVAQANLPHQMGEFYSEAVLSCLDCQAPQLLSGSGKSLEVGTGKDVAARGDDERGGVSSRMFVERVIYNLEKCHCRM